ncbi:protein of unknown function [Tepidibacter aestuarii]|nr:protein of unknown function [Tepidibacter aestuarii]
MVCVIAVNKPRGICHGVFKNQSLYLNVNMTIKKNTNVYTNSNMLPDKLPTLNGAREIFLLDIG